MLGCSYFEDGLQIDEGVGEGIELSDGVTISDIGMFKGSLVSVSEETFDRGAIFEDVFEFVGVSVESEAELEGVIEIDGLGASSFGAELGMVAGTGDGTFVSLG